MPLINTVTTIVTGNGNGNGQATAPGQIAHAEAAAAEAAAAAAAAEEENATEETSETEASIAPATQPSQSATAPANSDDAVISAVLSNAEPEERDDKVNASDYARRAAIATQAKLRNEALIDGMEAEAFAPLLSIRKDSEAGVAYSKSDAPFRSVEKTEVNA